MEVLVGPLAVAAILLAAGGVPKIARPHHAVRALSSVGPRLPPLVVRALGVAEILIAISALATGHPVAVTLVAGAYLVFAVYVAAALLRGGEVESCGCFGRSDTPPTTAHLVLDLAAAAVAAGAALSDAPPLVRVLGDQLWYGVPFLALVGLSTWLGYLALEALPRVTGLLTEGRS